MLIASVNIITTNSLKLICQINVVVVVVAAVVVDVVDVFVVVVNMLIESISILTTIS